MNVIKIINRNYLFDKKKKIKIKKMRINDIYINKKKRKKLQK